MHLVVIDTTLTTPPTGGAHTFLVDLVTGLGQRGWKVTVVSQPGQEDEIAASLRGGGAELILDLWTGRDLPEEKALKLSRWVNASHPDIYVVSASPDVGWLALPLLDSSIATITIAHNDVGAFYEPLKHYRPFVDCAIGVSQTTYRKLIDYCLVPASGARQIAYGITPLAESKLRVWRKRGAGEPLVIGYVGRIVQEQKRVLDFVPLVRELSERGVSFELHLIGAGPELKPLQEALTREGLSGSVKSLGWLEQEQVRTELLKLDVFILLSDYEGLPVALLEAMGHGVTPIVTAIESGNTQLVRDGENGFVVDVGDIRGFANRLEQLAADHEQLSILGRAAWITSQNYSINKMLDAYVEAFAQTANEVSHRRQRAGVTSDYPVMSSCRSKYPFWLRKVKQVVVEAVS